MNVETPIASTDPFRSCRIAAAALTLLTAALIAATAIDLARRPLTGNRSSTVGHVFSALPLAVTKTTGPLTDTRYGPMVPLALHDTGGGARRPPWEYRP